MTVQNKKPTAAKVASVTRIPGYKIKGVLGRGGMAVVYLAEQESIGREVALKVLAPDHNDATFSERFLIEAKIISQLSHPNIVTVFDAGVHQGNHYMAMEYVKGKTLSDARDELTLAQRIDVIKQIADALEYAGSKGYVHRDIKPENIMRHEDGRAILMDFGIARSLDTTKGLTVTGKAIGTPYYMSPEQTKGLKVDPRADIYSLGVVLFQMLVGRVPYDGPSFVAVGIKHISEPIPVLPPGLEAFQQIINNSMSKEPGHRYQTAKELKSALEALPETVLNKSPAKQNMASTALHQAQTVMETSAQSVAPVRQQKKSTDQPVATHAMRQGAVPNFRNTQKHEELPPIDITNSDDFKRLRWRRRLLYLMFISTLVFGGYHRQDIWMPTWQYGISPWLAVNIPQSKEILKYLPPAKERPKPVAVLSAPEAKEIPRPQSLPSDTITMMPGQAQMAETSKNSNVTGVDVASRYSLQEETVSEAPVKLTPEQEHIAKIEELTTGLDQHSENALKLAILYKSTLVHDRENVAAKQGLFDLEIWFGKTIRGSINNEEWEKARLLLNMLKESFPAALLKEQFRYMELQTESAEKLHMHLQKAQQHMQAKRLIKPFTANALEEFNRALQLSPENAEARQGIANIAEHFYKMARQQQKTGDIQTAINTTSAGLQAVKDHKGLLALQDELKFSEKHRQNINTLLGSARSNMVSGNLITPRGKSAYDLYQVILAESPGNKAALSGLEMIERKLVQHIQTLIKEGKYQQASSDLQISQQYFRNSRALDFLQRKLTSETYVAPATAN